MACLNVSPMLVIVRERWLTSRPWSQFEQFYLACRKASSVKGHDVHRHCAEVMPAGSHSSWSSVPSHHICIVAWHPLTSNFVTNIKEARLELLYTTQRCKPVHLSDTREQKHRASSELNTVPTKQYLQLLFWFHAVLMITILVYQHTEL